MNGESNETRNQTGRRSEEFTTTRRAVLAAGGVVALSGLAGCSSSDDGNGNNDSVCDVCKSRYGTTGWGPIFREMAVLSFCYERGLNLHRTFDTAAWQAVYDAVEATVSSRDPLEVTVTVELEATG